MAQFADFAELNESEKNTWEIYRREELQSRGIKPKSKVSSGWFRYCLLSKENPVDLDHFVLIDSDKLRECFKRKQISRRKKICAYCFKPKQDGRVRFCSDECRKEFSQRFSYVIESWFSLRNEALERDGYKCKKCGREASEVDHITEIADGGGAWSLDNLQSLCNDCHKEKTRESWKQRTRAEEILGKIDPDQAQLSLDSVEYSMWNSYG